MLCNSCSKSCQTRDLFIKFNLFHDWILRQLVDTKRIANCVSLELLCTKLITSAVTLVYNLMLKCSKFVIMLSILIYLNFTSSGISVTSDFNKFVLCVFYSHYVRPGPGKDCCVVVEKNFLITLEGSYWLVKFIWLKRVIILSKCVVKCIYIFS